MKLVRFSQGDGEVLIDPEKVSIIKKQIESYRSDWQPPIVYVIFGTTNEWLEFIGKDAEKVWDYFSLYGPPK